MTTFLSPAKQALIELRLLAREGARQLRTNYFIETMILSTEAELPIPHFRRSLSNPIVLLFADDEPLSNWAHRCRYFLFDAETGEYIRTIRRKLPPYFFTDQPPDSFVCFHRPVQFPARARFTNFTIPEVGPQSEGKRFAILYSGLSHACHVNDLGFMYQMLVQAYKYDPANIVVLNYNGRSKTLLGTEGTLTDYAASMPVNGPGDKKSFMKALSTLRLSDKDSLLIHTNNHGSRLGRGSYLFGYGGKDIEFGITPEDVAKALDNMPHVFRQLVVMMEQCNSGGFIDAVLSKSKAPDTSIATACSENRTSTSRIDFNPFAKHWISAMARFEPNGVKAFPDPDANKDNRVTTQEAFDYAKQRLLLEHINNEPQFKHKHKGNASSLGEPKFRWTSDLPLLEPIIRKKWPDYNSDFERVLEDRFELLLKLETELQQRSTMLHQEVLSQLVNALPARQIGTPPNEI